jgi:hypothetical protein
MKVISYTTKPGEAALNRARIEAVFAALDEARLADFAYMVVETNVGEFFHIVEATPTALEQLQTLPAFQEFSGTVAERQAQPSSRREAHIVGSYGVLVNK